MTQEHKVQFTQKQLDCLDKMYPEIVGNAATPEAEMRYRAGQRSVLAWIRTRLGSNPGGTTDGIPQ